MDIDIVEVESLIDEWVHEVQSLMNTGEDQWEAWDDVKGGDLPIEKVREFQQKSTVFWNDIYVSLRNFSIFSIIPFISFLLK